MTDKTQPHAGSTHIIRYALELGLLWVAGSGRNKVREALDALDTLEAQLEAIGAGGVSGPLMGRTAPPTSPAEQQAPSAAAADTVVLEAALRAIHQAIDLIGEPDTERLRTVRRVLRGAVIVAEDAGEAATAPQRALAPLSDDAVKDAARYRWLRENWLTMSSIYQRCITFRVGEPRWSDITEAELDAAIDAALAAQGDTP